jgi:hypothetical protein
MRFKPRYYRNRPYYSTLTRRYYSTYDVAFRESKRAGGGAYCDFNLFLVHPDGSFEFVF